MKKRIFYSVSIVSIISVIISCIFITVLMYNQLFTQIKNDIRYNATYLKESLTKQEKEDFLTFVENIPKSNRLTLIKGDGTVLYDNYEDALLMDNHKNRPEILEAASHGYGQSQRLSATLGKQTFYYAVRLDQDSILRISTTTDSVFALMGRAVPYLLLIVFAMAIVSLFAAGAITKKTVEPFNSYNIDDIALAQVYPELSPFVVKINKQKAEIKEHIKDLEKKQEEFLTITENMGEGLILLDKQGEILSVNSTALILLEGEKTNYIGKTIMELNRTLELTNSVNKAISGEKNEVLLKINSKEYSATSSPVMVENKLSGAVLLIVDITEKQEVEKLRKEFSANVSHELKTPLTSISGYAEIMKNGLVAQKDIIPFAEKIHKEAIHLINLVEDIIKISRLDEQDISLEKQEINLGDIINSVSERLMEQAIKQGVTLITETDNIKIVAIEQVVREIIYNLCENAIKYNMQNGKVYIGAKTDGNMAVITFKDTGVGIPQDSQNRVFERFYRVDKSHYKETGGTGLGLSIVKHGVKLHGGKIELESSDNGTIITVYLPVNI